MRISLVVGCARQEHAVAADGRHVEEAIAAESEHRTDFPRHFRAFAIDFDAAHAKHLPFAVAILAHDALVIQIRPQIGVQQYGFAVR